MWWAIEAPIWYFVGMWWLVMLVGVPSFSSECLWALIEFDKHDLILETVFDSSSLVNILETLWSWSLKFDSPSLWIILKTCMPCNLYWGMCQRLESVLNHLFMCEQENIMFCRIEIVWPNFIRNKARPISLEKLGKPSHLHIPTYPVTTIAHRHFYKKVNVNDLKKKYKYNITLIIT